MYADAELHIATPEYGLEYYNEHYADLVNNLSDVFFHGTLSIADLYNLMSEMRILVLSN